MNAAKVLIVDDDAALLNALSGAMRLRMPQVTLETCDSGLAAVERIAESDFDAVVTDVKMPGMDGLALLSEIRRLRPDIPTLLITGHGQHDLAVQALRGGAFDFIQKPIERDYFVASLTRAINMRQMSRQLDEQKRALQRHAAKLEQAVESRTRQLCEANRRKDEFLAMLSHELRNPLACVLGSVELLSRSAHDRPSTEECCEIIIRQARQMSRLLDDLLDLSRVSRNKIELRKTRLALSQVIEDSVATASAAISAREHRLEVFLDDALNEVRVYADVTRLEQVIVNLLSNAAKYTEPGGEISLAARCEGVELVIEVRDNGVGISPDVLPLVFEPFFQSEQSRHGADGGLGIGLTLVRQLVHLHGGSVEVDSEGLGQGSCFTVRLPIVDMQPEAGIANGRTVKTVPRGRRILLVDDNTNLARVTSLLLEGSGQHVVAVARDGPSGIEAALEHRPDLVLLDIGLPGMDGYQVARRIREYPQLDHTVLVAMTGYGRQDEHRQAKQAGFDHHLVKPFTIKTLEGLLAALPSRGALQSSTHA